MGTKFATLLIALSMFAGVGVFHCVQMLGWMNIIVPSVDAQGNDYDQWQPKHKR